MPGAVFPGVGWLMGNKIFGSRILFTYVAKEMLLYFFVLFLFFFFIFFINQILLMAEDVLSKHVPLRDVALLIVYSLPSIVATSAPFAALVGTLMATGRLVSDREFLAAETLGFSVRFLFLPVLATGLLISVVSFLVNDIFLPLGSIRFNRLRREIAASSPSVELESNSIKKNQNAVIVSGNISGNRMDEILILDADASGERRIIAAPGAVIADAADPAVLMTLRMDDASVFIFPEPCTGDYDWIQAASLSYHLLFRNLFGTNSGTVTPREMSSRDLYRELQVKEAAVPAAERETDRTLNMWRMEFHKKFSVPLGALFFSLLAFVLGLGAKTNGQAVGFVAGLLIAVLYWVLLVGGQTLCLRLSLDGMLTMWVPNAAVLLAALAVATVRIVK